MVIVFYQVPMENLVLRHYENQPISESTTYRSLRKQRMV